MKYKMPYLGNDTIIKRRVLFKVQHMIPSFDRNDENTLSKLS